MKFLVPGLTLLTLTLAPGGALAQDSDPSSDSAAEEETLPETPYERDQIGGHFQLAASAAYVMPFGKLSTDYLARQIAGAGPSFALDASYGLGRYVQLGAFGEFALLGHSKPCDTCSANTLTAGLLVRYHFVQGLRLDPWVSYGVGYRQMFSVDGVQLTGATENTSSYKGVEWLRLQLGADWYASSNLAFSPFGQFDASTMISRPGADSEVSTDLRFHFGLRVLFDAPGR